MQNHQGYARLGIGATPRRRKSHAVMPKVKAIYFAEDATMQLHAEAHQEIIAIDKQGQQVLFLDPTDLSIRASITGLPTRPHELLVLQEHGKAYVPIYGDGVHGDNP